ncbi:MAG TPA: hypothetical protein P5323_02195 [Candidatus Moranbacteria bacterium]|nr:hypothetical protein [Candidatus Moranbacteria bacterium]HRY27923.1 hypothetical protein [Candidatus Moranbacteria bacterium]HSA08658.1 hypothetical protein [Candidatus Moranbacteria bacterium]
MKNKIKSIKSYFLKNKKASILAYSLIVVSVMIVIATSISVVTVIEKKGAVSTDASVQAYQTADSGVQMAIKEINRIISTGNSSSTSIGSVFANCVDPNSADGSIFAGADYKLSFFSDEEGNTPIGCSATIDQIQSIKSVGTYKDTVRAVQVAVAASVPQMEFYTFRASGSDHGGGGQNIDCTWYQVKWNGTGTQLGTESFCALSGKDHEQNLPQSQAQVCAAYGDNVLQCQIRLKSGKWEYGAPIGNDYSICQFTCMRFK